MCKQNSMRLKPRVIDVCKAIETGMIIDHGHEKNFYRSIFTEIKEFATIVLWKLVINFGYRGHTILV